MEYFCLKPLNFPQLILVTFYSYINYKVKLDSIALNFKINRKP